MGGFKAVNFYDFKIKEHNVEGDEALQWNALLRFHFKITDPDKLSDDEFFKLCAQLQWVMEQENNKYKNSD